MAKLSDFISNTQPNTQTSSANAKQKSTGSLSAYIESNDVKPNKTKVETPQSKNPATSSMPLVSLTGPSGKEGEKILSPQELANIGKTTTPTTSKVNFNDIYYKFEADKAAGMAKQLQPKPSTVDRVANTIGGGLKSAAGQTVNAIEMLGKSPINLPFYALEQYNNLVAPKLNAAKDKVLTNTAEKLMDSGSKDIATAKQGASGLGEFAVDAGAGLTQLGASAALGAVTGGGALIPMALQAFGGGAYQAKQAGASVDKQVLYGDLQGAATGMVEGLSNVGGALTKAFGKGALDDILGSAMSKAINKFATSETGKLVASKLATGAIAGLGEGFENVVQDALTPVFQKLTYDPNAQWNAESMIYNALQGVALGGLLGTAGKPVTQANISSNNSTPTAQTGDNNVQLGAQNMQNSAVNSTFVDNQLNAKANIVPNVNTIAPNLVKTTQNIAQDTPQAPTSDFKPSVVTDTAKAAEVDTAQQVKPEATKPTVFYTGSSNPNITEFKAGGDGNTKQSGDSFGVGVYLTDNPDVAKLYAQGDSGKVYTVSTDSDLLNLEDKATPKFVKTVAESISDAPKQYRNRILRDVGRVKESFSDVDAAQDFYDKADEEWEKEDGQYSGNRPTVNKQGDVFTIEYTDYGSDLQNLLMQSTNRQLFEAIAAINTNDASGLVMASGYDGIIYHDGGAFNSGIEGNTAVVYRNTHRIKQVDEAIKPETQSPSLSTSNPLVANVTKGMPQGTGAMSNPFAPEQKVSKVYSNTYQKTESLTDEQRAKMKPEDYTYDVETHAKNEAVSQQRVDVDFEGEALDLYTKQNWSAEDVFTSKKILDRFKAEDDFEKIASWTKRIQQEGTKPGQTVEAFKAFQNTPEGAVIKAQQVIAEAEKKITKKKELGKDVDNALGRQVKTETAQVEKAVKEESANAANDVVNEIAQTTKKQGEKREGKKPQNLNPLAKKTDAEKAAEKLANKVDSTTKERKAPEVNAINDMVNELFKSAKESPLPEQTPRPKRSPIEFLTQAIANKAEYTDVWNNAKEILLEKYSDNPEVLNMLNDYFEKGIVPTYSDATLTGSVKQMLKDLGIKLSQMKELTWENRQRVIKSLTNYLVEQTGAVDGDAKMLKRDAADKITKLIIDSAPKLTKQQKLEIKQATQDAMRKHGVPVETWADETGRLISEGIAKTFEPQSTPKDKAMTQIITDDIKKFVGTIPKPLKTTFSRNAIDAYTDFMENRQYYTTAWEKLQSELKAKYANNPEALKAIDNIINRDADTAAKDYYNKQLDGMINKALKSINVKLSELVTQGKASKEATVKAVTDILVNEHGIDGETAKTVSENIAERFNEMLKEKASQRIANIIKAKSSIKIKQTERQRMNALMNLGSFDMDSLSDLIKAKYGVPTITSADAQKIYELNKLAQETNNDYQKRVFENRAARIIADKLPVKGKDKVLAVRRIAMLLNPKTLISRNAGGNVIFGLLDDIKDMPGTLIDLAVSTKTGQRTTSYNPPATAKAEAQGFKKGIVEWGKDIKNKVDTSPTQHEMPQAPALKSTVGKGFESALNKLLQLGDRPFYELAYAKRIDELKRLGRDYTSDDAIAEANVYALERVFQNNSTLAKKAMEMRDSLGVIGDIAMPFAQTPANIFDKLADYSPLGYVRAIKKAGTIKDSAWSQKQFVDTLARSMTGTGILAFAFFAAKSGLITGGDNKEEDEALTYQKKISGWQPYSIVVGDKSYTYDWATVVGALLSLGADIAQSDDGGETLSAILMNGAKAGINTMFNQSYMEGVAELFGSSTNGKADIGKGLESMLVSLPASFTPTAFQQIAKIIDPIARDTYDTDPLKKAWNKVKAKLPFLSQTLPAKISASGQESTNYQGGKLSNILESTLSPGFIGETQKTAIDSEVQRLYKVTDDTAVLPNWSEYTSKSDLSFSGNGTEYTMTAKEWETYQKTRGQYTYKELNTLINSSEYKSMTDEGKAKAVSDIYSAATLNAKQTVVESRGEMFVPSVDAGNKIEKYQSAGLSQKQAYDFYKTVEALEPIDGEKEVSTYQKVQTIGQQGYTDTQAIALVGTLYTDSSKESMLPYLTTSKHLLSLYLTNKDSEMISMTIPSKVTAKSVEYELTDKEKELFKTTYANYFNSRVTNVSSATAIKSLRDKAFDAAKSAVINGR